MLWPTEAEAWLPGFLKPADGSGTEQPPSRGAEPRLAPRSLDRLLQSMLGRMTLGISPASLGLAYVDWALHLGMSPGKQQELAEKALRKIVRFATHVARGLQSPQGMTPCIEPLPQDHRFRDTEWQQLPFNLVYQWFLLH
jgi:polyhydroxyalkanoate synthase